MRLYKQDYTYRAEDLVTSVPFTVGGSGTAEANPWTKASDWAVPEMERANGQGLIPDALKNKDLTLNVTRAEFAAVAVKVYENLTGTKATAPAKNPFDDTSDAEVLKAYNTGLMVGVSESKFDPGAILNREQMATALTRVLKRAYIPGWTMQADGDYTLNFAQPSKFADDAATSDWAKPSVYFMFAKEIISGTGGNQFSPKQNATREQSVAIGLRIVEKLKGKPLDYAKSGTENPPSGDNPWTGTWESRKTSLFGSDWGTLVLTQNGNTVTGTYNATKAGFDKGTITGTVSGNNLAVLRNGITNENKSYLFTLIDNDHIDVETTYSSGFVSPTDNFIRVTPTSNVTISTQPSNGDNRLVGRWLCDYYPLFEVVFFFDSDGTFFSVSIYRSSSAIFHSVENFKGNYEVIGDTIEFTNLYRYINDIAGWRDVPFGELEKDVPAIQITLDIQKIIEKGTRTEVEALLNADHSYYHQTSNQGWKSFSSKTGDIVFQDQNHMKNNIFGTMHEYEKVD